MAGVTTILCAADPRGSEAAAERLVRACEERAVDAVALVGDLSAGAGASYRPVFHAELVNPYRPRLVIGGGARGSEQLGTSLVVAPGSLCDGDYAVVDLRRGSVERFEPARAVGR
jgi:Icc-related predicted phosphoesterase